ncbi:MAG TPA: glycosyltransferase, partial [Miltoncostaea sp.]|nr:glycosyltransferase [Miltoncostaea sp.]
MSALASIVVPCHDNLRYTALCLDSIARHTPEPHEVVVVDNGCTDATAEWARTQGARVVRSRTNLGFAGGVNLGLAVAAGDVAVLLNHDALATPGWLAALLGALDGGAGVAGPRSNWVSD